MNILYGTLLVVGMNAALILTVFKAVQWVDKFMESKKNGKNTHNQLS